jgi:chromate reductase
MGNNGDAPGPVLRVLGIPGSLRQGSLNRALLRAAAELAPDGLRIEIHDLREVPLYDGDVEAAGDPPGVAAFKAAIREADAILVACPEYNHGVPGVLKNAIDWASRPAGASPLNGKPAGIIGASPGLVGTARGQAQLRQAFTFTNTSSMLQPEVLVAQAHTRFDREGRLVDETSRGFLAQYLAAFHAWLGRMRR